MVSQCANCGTADPGACGWRLHRCDTCYQYRRRTGRERPLVPCWAGVPVQPNCATCGRLKRRGTGTDGRECARCRNWRTRKGVAWPVGAIQRVRP